MGDAGSARKIGSAAAPALPAWQRPRRVLSTHSGQELAWSPCSSRSSSRLSLSHWMPVSHGEAFLTHFCCRVNRWVNGSRPPSPGHECPRRVENGPRFLRCTGEALIPQNRPGQYTAPGEGDAPYYGHSKIGHRNALAPVVQDIDLVGERYLRSFQLGNSHSNTPRCHIPCCIMLCVQEEKSSMVPASGEDEVMQIQEILKILGEENIALADGIREMLGVRDPRVLDCRWEQHDVAHPL